MEAGIFNPLGYHGAVQRRRVQTNSFELASPLSFQSKLGSQVLSVYRQFVCTCYLREGQEFHEVPTAFVAPCLSNLFVFRDQIDFALGAFSSKFCGWPLARQTHWYPESLRILQSSRSPIISWLGRFSKRFFKGRNKGFPGEGPQSDPQYPNTSSSAPTLTEQKALKKDGRLHLAKRGAGAFVGHSHEALARSVGGTNRLHAHACTDDTSLKHYLPAVKKFLLWVNLLAPPITTIPQKDRALADYLAYLCYDEQKGLPTGLHAFSGFNAVFCECIGQLPESNRAVKAWQKLEILGEGAPIPWEGVGAVACWMREQGTRKFSVASDLCLIAADCYLRQADWALANHEDVSVSLEYGVALHLGIAEQGGVN